MTAPQDMETGRNSEQLFSVTPKAYAVRVLSGQFETSSFDQNIAQTAIERNNPREAYHAMHVVWDQDRHLAWDGQAGSKVEKIQRWSQTVARNTHRIIAGNLSEEMAKGLTIIGLDYTGSQDQIAEYFTTNFYTNFAGAEDKSIGNLANKFFESYQTFTGHNKAGYIMSQISALESILSPILTEKTYKKFVEVMEARIGAAEGMLQASDGRNLLDAKWQNELKYFESEQSPQPIPTQPQPEPRPAPNQTDLGPANIALEQKEKEIRKAIEALDNNETPEDPVRGGPLVALTREHAKRYLDNLLEEVVRQRTVLPPPQSPQSVGNQPEPVTSASVEPVAPSVIGSNFRNLSQGTIIVRNTDGKEFRIISIGKYANGKGASVNISSLDGSESKGGDASAMGVGEWSIKAEPTPPIGRPAAPSSTEEGSSPEWLEINIDLINKLYEASGAADRIEILASERKTAKEIAAQMAAEGFDLGDGPTTVVRAIRAKRGIPALDHKKEFTEWLNRRTNSEPTPFIPPSADEDILPPGTWDSNPAESDTPTVVTPQANFLLNSFEENQIIPWMPPGSLRQILLENSIREEDINRYIDSDPDILISMLKQKRDQYRAYQASMDAQNRENLRRAAYAVNHPFEDIPEPQPKAPEPPRQNVVEITGVPEEFVFEMNTALERSTEQKLNILVPVDTVKGYLTSIAGDRLISAGNIVLDKDNNSITIRGLRIDGGFLGGKITLDLSLTNSNQGIIATILNYEGRGAARGEVEKRIKTLSDTFRRKIEETLTQENSHWGSDSTQIVDDKISIGFIDRNKTGANTLS